METIAEVADSLDLEIVHGRRRHPAFVMRANTEPRSHIEQFTGKPKWPELRVAGHGCRTMKFPNGGVFGRVDWDHQADDKLYFDGISFSELAQFLERAACVPVMDQTGDKKSYCFALPQFIERQFFNPNTTTNLPGLGVSVTSATVEMEALVVRDRQPKDNPAPKP